MIPAASPCLFYPMARRMGISVKELLSDARLQAEALLRLQEYPSGAVIRMTELWCEAASLGMACDLSGEGFPQLGGALECDIEKLADLPLPEAINPVTAPLVEAVELAVPELEKPLIVGATAPYTLASVLNGSEDFMVACLVNPQAAHRLLERLTGFLTGYIGTYKAAGARGVMLCEPSVAMLSPEMSEEFSNRYIERIIEKVQDEAFAVIYHNCGAVSPHLDVIAGLSAAGFHFGSDVDLGRALACIPADRFVMGNVDPRLFLTPEPGQVGRITRALREKYAGQENFILSSGCDLAPGADPAALDEFFTNASI